MKKLLARLGGRGRWFGLGAVLGLAVAALLALAWRATAAPAYTVQPAALVRTLQFSARVAALTRVEVGSTLTGRVERVAVREGDAVQRGQLLVLLETEELRAAQSQALAGERQAQATVQAAQATLARTEQLVRQNYTSAAQLDEARRALDVAQAQLGAARAAVQVAQARLAQARIGAPASARVLARAVEPGQIVQPGKPLLTLALHGPTELVAPVDERFLGQLQVGQPAAVVADAYPTQRLAAQVLRIAPLVDAQRGTVEVRLALRQEPPAFLREDMTLSVEVETARREQALTLPLALLHAVQGDRARVWVAQEGVAQERTVRLGLRTLEVAEVLEGLRPGEQVLSGAAWRIGQRVRTLPWDGGASVAAVGSGGGGAGAAALSNAMGR